MADILVVSPYNVQVNHPKSILPAGARVGTVDKFQGQEAPVVLISMATSSADDMPRSMEFLYSRNRLNVAISRARSLAVVVAKLSFQVRACTIQFVSGLWAHAVESKGTRHAGRRAARAACLQRYGCKAIHRWLKFV